MGLSDMAPTVAKRLPDAPRKNLAMGIESVRKPLAKDIGAAIERAIVLANLTKQDVAYRMGYADQSALSRWISGVETAQLPSLWEIKELRWPLLRALAEISGTTAVDEGIRRIA